MNFEGAKKPDGSNPEGQQASEALKVFNIMQQRAAIARFRDQHPERDPDLERSEDRNEVMMDFVTSGEAEGFRSEYGGLSQEGIREALDTVFPGRRNQEDETLH